MSDQIQVDERELRAIRLTAEILADTVKQQGTPRALITLSHDDPQQEALVMVFIGKEQIDKIRTPPVFQLFVS